MREQEARGAGRGEGGDPEARNEYEREEKERRADLQKQERRLQQKEENLDRKTENMERKEEHLSNRWPSWKPPRPRRRRSKQSQMEVLERISGFTAEEAKKYLLDQLEADVTHESAMKIKEIEARFKDEADTKPGRSSPWPSSAAPPTTWRRPPCLWSLCPMTK